MTTRDQLERKLANLQSILEEPFKEETPEDKAFLAPSYPSNALPFLNRMVDIVKHKGTGAMSSKEFRANLIIVLGLLFGQLAVIDLFDMWTKLKRDFDEKDEKGNS